MLLSNSVIVSEQIKIFADGADLSSIRELSGNPLVKGFTTNPTLMRQAGVSDYLAFARDTIEIIGDRPISLEVFSDDLDEMIRQGLILSQLGPNVNVKIPVTNTQGRTTTGVVKALVGEGVSVNVTAIFTLQQIDSALSAVRTGPKCFISVFAGRIADTGIDPVPLMIEALKLMQGSDTELIWASPREVLNVVQGAKIGCHIITVTHDLIKKLQLIGKDLTEYSLETVKMFERDATLAGYVIP